jgi:hypothetical protein
MLLPYDDYVAEIISLYGLKAVRFEHHERCPNCGGNDRLEQPRAVTASHSETADDSCRLIAQLDDHFRVIRCKQDGQLIMQKRDGFRSRRPRWEPRGYHLEPKTVQRLVLELCDIIDAVEFQGLQCPTQREAELNDRIASPIAERDQ